MIVEQGDSEVSSGAFGIWFNADPATLRICSECVIWQAGGVLWPNSGVQTGAKEAGGPLVYFGQALPPPAIHNRLRHSAIGRSPCLHR